jgi:hypothetical protein
MIPSRRATSRRGLVKLLISAGLPAPLALNLIAQSRTKISEETLKQASAILGTKFTDERLKVIETALQRNLDQYQTLRDFEVDDLIEPAPVFLPLKHSSTAKESSN